MGAAKGSRERPTSVIDERLVKALSHHYRVQILEILNDNRRVASPIEIAKMLDTDVSNLSYHIGVLVDCDCIELVGTEPVRGSVKHFYRATERALFNEDAWAVVPAEVRSTISGKMWGDIFPVVARSLATGAFDSRTERHLSWVRMKVDEEGWEEIRSALEDLLPVVLEAQARSEERRLESDEMGLPIAVLLSMFPTAENSSAV